MEKERNIGEAKLVGQPKAPFRFKLKDGCVKSNHLAEESVATGNIQNGAVSTEKIMDEAVTNAKIMNGAITNSKISNGTITNEKIANNSIDNSKIQDLTLTGAKFINNSIDGNKILDNSIPGSKLADGAIESVDLQDGTLDGRKLVDNSVLGDKLVDGAVTSEKLKDNSIDGSKIADGTIQSLDIKDGTISGSKLVDNSIPGTKLSDGIINNNKIANNTITGDKFLDESISGEKIIPNTIHGSKLETGTVDGADIIAGTLDGSKIKNMSIDGDHIQDNSIETRHIKSNTITGSKIVANSIDSTKIRNNSLIGENFADRAITNAKIVDNTVTNSKIANNTITSDKIVDGAITTDKLANSSVRGASIADNAINNDKLQDGSIIGRNIATGTLTGDKFVDDTITGDKIQDNTVSGSKLKDGTIESVDIKDGTLSGAKLVNNSVDGAKLADNSITSSHLIDNSIPGSKIKDGTIENVDIKDGTLDGSKLKDGSILTAKIYDGAVTNAKIAAEAITTDKIDNLAVTEGKLATGAVTNGKIANDAVTENKLSTGSVTVDKIADESVTEAKLGTGAVTNTKLVDGSVTENKIGTGAVTADKINSNAVTTDKIADLSVTTAKIADGAVTEAKLADGSITSDKIADSTIIELQTIMDEVPTEGSVKPVMSGGVYAELNNNYAKKDGAYETLLAGSALNLQGQHVSLNSSMYRTTAGSEDVASGIAELVSVKGNTVKWNYLIKEFKGTYYGLDVKTHSDGVVTIYGTTNSSTGGNFVGQLVNYLPNHKYFIDLNLSVNTPSFFISFFCPHYNYVGNNIHGIYTTSSDRKRQLIRVGTTKDLFVNAKYKIIIIDLTLIYGEGNEPSTAEEFEADYFRWFGKPLSYEPYDSGSLRPVLMNSIKTVGFNQYNPSNGLVKAIVGSQYQITGTYNSIWESDEEEVSFVSYTYGEITEIGLRYSNGNGRFICNSDIASYSNTSTYGVGQFVTYDGSIYKCSTAISTAEEWDATKWDLIADVNAMVTEGIFSAMNITPDSNGLFIPARMYVHVEGGSTDTCVHLTWSGTRNGEYEPYKEHVVPFDVTQLRGKLNGEGDSVVVFPDGMKKVNGVYDEIVIRDGRTYAIKRVGSVDLGSINWSYTNLYNFFGGTLRVKNAGAAGIPNLLCVKYNAVSWSSIYNKSKVGIGIYPTNSFLCVYDSSFTQDASGAANFKTAMQGVYLYYELAQPQEYVLDDINLPINLTVDDWGTEEVVGANGSCAPTLGIIYGINAVDQLRRMPQSYISEASMDNFLSRLGSVMGGTWSKTWNAESEQYDFSFTQSVQLTNEEGE